MAKVGIKCLTYAKYSQGGDGSSMVYTGGKMLEDYLAKAELKENRNKQQEYADDHQIDGENMLTGVNLLFSINFLVVIFTLLFDDLFNTIGTLAGIASSADMLDKNGRLPRAKMALLADALATSAGALLGATTTTTYVESATGILAGGKTRLTAYATAGLFLISIVFAPLFTAIPAFAIAPALFIVGYCMVAHIVRINFNDLPEALPCLMAIVIMPFSYNIADGIFFGFIFWTVINLICGRKDRVNAFLITLSILFILKYIFL